jgi:hypothetical protein
MVDKNSLANALLQQNGYIDVPVLISQNVTNFAGLKTYPFDIPPSRCISHILMEVGGGVTPAVLTETRVKPLGEPLQTFVPEDLDLINQYFKQPPAALAGGTVWIYDVSQTRQNLRGGDSYINFTSQTFVSGSAGDLMEATELNCGSPDASAKSINQLKIEIDVTGYAAGAGGYINLLLLAGPPFPGGPGLLKRIDKDSIVIGAGQQTLTKTNLFHVGDRQHQILDALFFIPPSDAGPIQATLDNWQVWFNDNEIRQRSEYQNEFIQTIGLARAPQALLYAIDFTELGFGDKSLPIGDPNTDFYIKVLAGQNGGTPLPGTMTVYSYSCGYLY